MQIHNFVNNILITKSAERYENHFYQTIPERSAGGEGIATICSITNYLTTINNKIMVEIEGVDSQMILSNLKPKYVTHPGEIIMDEIEYMQISQKEFAERIGISCSQVNQILKGKRPVNTEFALLTEAATGIPADLLLRMQTRYDSIKAENKPDFMEKLKKIRKFAAAL